MFDIKNLETTFAARIEQLEQAENTVREVLRDLSRDVLFALHEHGNIVYVNQLVKAKMTSINRKAMVLFLQEFTGFHYDEATKDFTKKNKGTYDAKAKACAEFLEDPHNNFWSWSERAIEIVAKDFELKRVTKFIETSLKKAGKAGISQADVMRAVLAGGIELGTVVAILEAAAPKEEQPAE